MFKIHNHTTEEKAHLIEFGLDYKMQNLLGKNLVVSIKI